MGLHLPVVAAQPWSTTTKINAFPRSGSLWQILSPDTAARVQVRNCALATLLELFATHPCLHFFALLASQTTIAVTSITISGDYFSSMLTTNVSGAGERNASGNLHTVVSEQNTTLFLRQLQNSTPAGPVLSQWATSVMGFSSQWDSVFWSATQALGNASTDGTGISWSPSGQSNICPDGNPCPLQREWIELSFDKPVYPTSIVVFESSYPGNTICLEVGYARERIDL